MGAQVRELVRRSGESNHLEMKRSGSNPPNQGLTRSLTHVVRVNPTHVYIHIHRHGWVVKDMDG